MGQHQVCRGTGASRRFDVRKKINTFSTEMHGPIHELTGDCLRPAPGLLTPGSRPPSRTLLVCSFPALCSFKSRVLMWNSIGPVGVGTTTTLLVVRALHKNCRCVHSICQRRPACPPPSWLRTWRARANLLVTTLNMRSGRLQMPER